MPDTPTLTDLATAYDKARAEVTAYVSAIETAHREQYPDPVGADGRPKWSAEQAALRTAAWTEEQRTEVSRLREAERAAVMALTRAREGGGA